MGTPLSLPQNLRGLTVPLAVQRGGWGGLHWLGHGAGDHKQQHEEQQGCVLDVERSQGSFLNLL